MLLLEIKDIDTFYGPSHVLFDVSLNVVRGGAVGLLGRNGAGKSTTMKGVIGLVPPTEGEILYRGQNIVGLSPYQICRSGVGYVPEERRIFWGLTVMENLEISRRNPRWDTNVLWEPERIFDLFPALRQMANRRGGSISGGEQQMLCIARALMGNPEMLLLDEPSEGLAPVVVQELLRQIRNLKSTGVTFLLSEQNLKFATQVVDRIYIIEKGQIKYEGTPKDLEANEEIKRQYLSV
jgi:branched-chain amino acid transport system ATP-binding protein